MSADNGVSAEHAQLIAAAPQMLEALQNLVDAAHGSDDEGIPEAVAAARAAIRAAEGDENG